MHDLVQKLDTFFHSANPSNTLASPHNNSLTALQLYAKDDATTLEEANNPHDEFTSGKCICTWIASRTSTLKPNTKPLEALEYLAYEIYEAVLEAENSNFEGKDDKGSIQEDLEAKVILEKVENLRRCVQYRLVMQAARSDETSTPPYLIHSERFDNSKSSTHSTHSSRSDLRHLTSLDYFKPTVSRTFSSIANVQQPLSHEIKPTVPYLDTSIPFSTHHSMKSQIDLRNAMAAFEFDALTLLDGAGDHLVNDPNLNAEDDIAVLHTLTNIPHSMIELSEKVKDRISARAAPHRKELKEDIYGLQGALAGVKDEVFVPSIQASELMTNDLAIGTEQDDEVTGSLTKIGEILEKVGSHLKDQVESQAGALEKND